MSQILLALLFGAGFAGLYLLNRLGRIVAAWFNNTPGPRERFIPYLVLCASFGMATGALAHEPMTAVQQCRAAGISIGACLLVPKQ